LSAAARVPPAESAGQDAFTFRQRPGPVPRLLVGHRDEFVEYLPVQDCRDEVGRPALDLVRRPLLAASSEAPSGSVAMIFTSGRASLIISPAPVSVPPVPQPVTK
jgi:hypothetical protein